MKQKITVDIDSCGVCPSYDFTGNGRDEEVFCNHDDAPDGGMIITPNYEIPRSCPRIKLDMPYVDDEPIVVIVNGFPRSGKDTFCSFTRGVYTATNYSTVDTVKEIASEMGWNGIKTDHSRNMLSALKDFYVEWFDGTFKEITNLINKAYYERTTKFIFLHTREPEEIERVANRCDTNDYTYFTVFIDRPTVERVHGNHADANVTGFDYDIYLDNDGTIEEFKKKSLDIFTKMIDNDI